MSICLKAEQSLIFSTANHSLPVLERKLTTSDRTCNFFKVTLGWKRQSLFQAQVSPVGVTWPDRIFYTRITSYSDYNIIEECSENGENIILDGYYYDTISPKNYKRPN